MDLLCPNNYYLKTLNLVLYQKLVTWSSGDSDWYVTQDGSSAYFTIPAHTWYAVCNDDAPGSNNNGCCDYLATPVVDLRDYEDYVLRFQSYYDGGFGNQLMQSILPMVKISIRLIK